MWTTQILPPDDLASVALILDEFGYQEEFEASGPIEVEFPRVYCCPRDRQSIGRRKFVQESKPTRLLTDVIESPK